MKKTLLYLLLFFFSFSLFAQSITTTYNGGEVCVGKTINVSYTTTGTFGGDNKFSVQLNYSRYIDGIQKDFFINLETNSGKNPLQVVLPDTIRSISTFRLRVVSSSPEVLGSFTNYIYFKFPLSIEFDGEKLINPNEYTTLSGRVIRGSTPAQVYLSDSSIINLSSYTSYFNITRNPSQTTSYSILKTENECGVEYHKTKNSINLIVNPIGFKLIKSDIPTPCPGGKIFLTYDADKPFKEDNRFYIKLVYMNRSNQFKTIEVDCEVINKNTLSFDIPKDFGEQYVNVQYFDLFSTSPAAQATWNNGRSSFSMQYSTPNLLIDKTKVDVNWGESANIRVIQKSQDYFSGDLYLFDGNRYYYPSKSYSADTYYDFKVSPQTTTQYQLIAKQNSCDQFSKVYSTIDVVVNAGIQISKSPKVICEGTEPSITIKKYGTYNTNNVFSVEYIYYSDLGQQKVILPSKMLNDSTIQYTFASGYFPSTFAYENEDNGTIRVRSSSPFSVSQNFVVSIKRFPTFSLRSGYTYNYSNGGDYIYLNNTIEGGRPYKLLVNDGEKDFKVPILVFYPAQSTVYTIKEVENACGKASVGNPRANVTIQKPSVQSIQTFPSPYSETSPINRHCLGSTIQVPFIVNGKADTSDIFHFEIRLFENGQTVWKSLASSKSSPINLTIPSNLEFIDYYFRISNQKKQVVSNAEPIYFARKPTAKLTPESTLVETIKGNYNSVPFSLSGGGFITVELSNGQKETMYRGGNDNSGYMVVYPSKTETFTIKSISNECGIGTSEGTYTIDVKNFRIISQRSGNSNHSVCEGHTISLSKSIEGFIPKDIKLGIQMSDVEGKNFGDIASYQIGDELYGIIPAGAASGGSVYTLAQRKFRIISTNYEAYYQPTNFISLSVRPTAKITGEKGESSLTQVDGTAKLKIEFTGNSTYFFNTNKKIEASDNPNLDYNSMGGTSNNPFIYTIRPKTKGEFYEITNLWNGCGYGSFSGKVEIVSIKPTLQIQTITNTNLCAGKELMLNIDASGEFDASNVFKFELISGTKSIELLQTKTINGSIKVQIPTNILAGTYTLKLSSTSPSISAAYTPYLNISPLPNVTLSGNASIILGEKTALSLKESQGSTFSYLLSDGFQEQITYLNDGSRHIIQVSPIKTTEYKLTKVFNSCGNGVASGSVIVEVLPAMANSVGVNSIRTNSGSALCTGKQISVNYITKGTFSPSNKFTVQVSDENGLNYRNLPTTNGNPLVAELPTDLKVSENYRFRILSSDKEVASPTSNSLFRIFKGSTAQLKTNSLVLLPNQTGIAKISLSDNPYKYVYFGTDSLFTNPYFTNDTTLSIEIAFTKAATVYKLFSIYDSYCGLGTVIGNNKLSIELITANELSKPSFNIFPNPSSSHIIINNLGLGKKTISLTNVSGKKVMDDMLLENYQESHEINLMHLSGGVYLLNLFKDGQKFTFKVYEE